MHCHVLCLFLAILVMSPRAGTAAPRSGAEAMKVAAQWRRLDDTPLAMKIGKDVRRIESIRDKSGNNIAHIVYMAPGGFVIVSADDEIEPIMGFCSGNVFDPSPDNPLGALVGNDLSGRLDVVRKHGKGLGPAGLANGASSKRKWALLQEKTPLLDAAGARQLTYQETGFGSITDIRVAPFVLSQWDLSQENSSNCYNYYTPNNDPCGCVATAMAQLMRYHKWPVAGVGTNSFEIHVDASLESRQLRGGDGAGGPYIWDDMVLDPDASITDAQRRAIGSLCHDAGVAVNMNYAGAASAADTLQARFAFVSTFFYSSAANAYDDGADLGANLIPMINPNLHAGHPVLLGIRGAVGHAIVCDGYGYNSGTLYHHLNVGFGGADNVWYCLPTIATARGTYTTVYKCVYNVYTSGVGEIVSGRITDSGGAPVPDALITAQTGDGASFCTTSDSLGGYAVAKVPSATRYWISVSKAGYAFSNRLAETGVSIDYTVYCGNVVNADFAGASAAGPDTPVASAAWARNTNLIDLVWQKNAATDDVMIAWSTNAQFGVPSGSYSTGDVVAGGGIVISRGIGTNYSHNGLATDTDYFYMVWSVDADTNYSAGCQLSARTLRAYTLSVGSQHGGAVPSAGDSQYCDGSVIAAQVTNSPVFAGAFATQYVCTGWIGTGSVTNGDGTSVMFALTSDSSLVWQWRTNYWLGTATNGSGSVDTGDGWISAGSNVTVAVAAGTNWHFAGWSGDTNDCVTNANSIIASMVMPRRITALFAANLATNNTPHWWLAQYGLSMNDTGALYDDGDGMPAWAEYVAGTDPTNRLSVLAVTNVLITDTGAAVFWTGGSTATQYLEVRTSLTSTDEQWKVIATNAPPTPTSTNCIDSTTNAGRFYRIRVVR